MKQLCLDQRFEVRNCALITLVKTLTTHGNVIDISTWHIFIWDILFPMLDDIRVSASAAATDEVNVELGKQGGRTVKLLVHHSRNSVQKQWNETLLLSFGGIVRVLRLFADKLLANLNNFIDIWRKVIIFGEQLTSQHSKEVSENVISNFKELLIVAASKDSFNRDYWLPVWNSIYSISVGFISSFPPPADTTTSSLSASILHIYKNYQTVSLLSNFSSLFQLLLQHFRVLH